MNGSMLDGQAITQVADLAREGMGNHEPVDVGGYEYTTAANRLERVKQTVPSPDALRVSTLTALVAYLGQEDYGDPRSDDPGYQPKRYLHVVSPTEVRLISELVGVEMQRHVYAVASPVLPDPLDRSFTPEAFIVALQSRCVESADRDLLIALASNVTAGSELSATDDGLGQTVTAKSQLTLVQRAGIKNPVHLAPFRTFPEVEQPDSAYVIRAQRTDRGEVPIQFTLTEADGGAWRIEAVQRIQHWLELRSVGIPVLA